MEARWYNARSVFAYLRWNPRIYPDSVWTPTAELRRLENKMPITPPFDFGDAPYHWHGKTLKKLAKATLFLYRDSEYRYI
jgi:hypothetical protein